VDEFRRLQPHRQQHPVSCPSHSDKTQGRLKTDFQTTLCFMVILNE